MQGLEDVKQLIARCIAEAMYMEVDEIQDNLLFSSFGLESTTLVKILNKVNEELGLKVDIREVLPHQNLIGMSQVIHKQLAGEIV